MAVRFPATMTLRDMVTPKCFCWKLLVTIDAPANWPTLTTLISN
jgi:hypothetical protein